jgi:hypothetical protein
MAAGASLPAGLPGPNAQPSSALKACKRERMDRVAGRVPGKASVPGGAAVGAAPCYDGHAMQTERSWQK